MKNPYLGSISARPFAEQPGYQKVEFWTRSKFFVESLERGANVNNPVIDLPAVTDEGPAL